MKNTELFVSGDISDRDMAGVFEYEENVGYFYLCEKPRGKKGRILAHVRVVLGDPDFGESDIEVRWTKDQKTVGLFIRGLLWAAFSENKEFGGNYRANAKPDIPAAIHDQFR